MTTQVSPPFNNLKSFLINAEILGFWDYSDEVIDLCMDLNHNSRRYYRSETHRGVLKSILKVKRCERIQLDYLGIEERKDKLNEDQEDWVK